MKVVSKVLSRLDRIDQLIWRFKQPLTQKPSDPRSVVSDLFVWRKGQGWRTFFELTDIASLFGQFVKTTVARVLIFDQSGGFIGESTFTAPRYSRLRVDISALAAPCQDNVGTFCVLHSQTPDVIVDLGSNLAERGYVSYCYGESSLKSYVHGNLDAVASSPSGAIELLAGTSFLKREYRLQHDLKKGNVYELAVVNASTKARSVQCQILTTSAKKKTNKEIASLTHFSPALRYCSLEAKLKPGACHIFHINANEFDGNSVHAVLRSHLVMLRPIVFTNSLSCLNVFHA